jgi:hypothetical protein
MEIRSFEVPPGWLRLRKSARFEDGNAAALVPSAGPDPSSPKAAKLTLKARQNTAQVTQWKAGD